MQKYENNDRFVQLMHWQLERTPSLFRVISVSTEDVIKYKYTAIEYLLPIKQQVDSPHLEQQMTAYEGLDEGCRAGAAYHIAVPGSPVEKD